MTTFKTCLWFDDNGHEAADFYCDLFDEAEVLGSTPGHPDMPGYREDVPVTVEFRLGDQQFLVLNGGPQFPLTEAVSIQVYVKDQAELDRVWDGLLAAGGEATQCGWLKDRFGMSWQVIPTRFMELTSDPATARQATAQMLTMTKLDIAPLEEAARQPADS